MLFVLSVVTAMSCVLWPVQFLSRQQGTSVFLNLFLMVSWVSLASAYVHRAYARSAVGSDRVSLLPRRR